MWYRGDYHHLLLLLLPVIKGLTSWTSVCSQYIHATGGFMICPRLSSNHNSINYT
ncbi:hypothetical protein HanPSC8_Chr08g0308911 [Helianthus annuus]|nr:hypothetical protein HanPSC8_Chr08g0308911 [Helianthus annuus]